MPAMNDAADTTTDPARSGQPEGSLKETIEAIVIAFVLAFVFRAFVVEAFVIPTGSMAPTLLGAHVSMIDPQTGYKFKVGPWTPIQEGSMTPAPQQAPRDFVSPMGAGAFQSPTRRIEAGDRILVLKYLYGVTDPRRWDVVVFKNPETPTQNYIKRLVGLPNENLRIIRGNVYTQPHAPSSKIAAAWHVQVKPDRVQQAVWQPVYHSQFVPLRPDDVNWRSPWRHHGNATPLHLGRAFDVTGSATLTFDYQALGERFEKDFYPYNDTSRYHAARGGLSVPAFTIEDLRVAVGVRPETDDGVDVTLEQLGELIEIRAVVTVEGEPALYVRPAGTEGEWVRVAGQSRHDSVRWRGGHTTRLELWHVDHRISLWADGQRLLSYDVPVVSPGGSAPDAPVFVSMDRMLEDQLRGLPERAPRVGIATQGAARLSELDLDRDLYYTPGQVGSNQFGTRSDAFIGPDQFYCLGDNSPHSKDSRMWEAVHPSIRDERQLPDQPVGLVPRRLMIGRAFFVYFPSPLSHGTTSWAIVPNFGELRFIH
jgi:signal peptidase I